MGTGGSGAGTSASCVCPAGQYCRDGVGPCLDCADRARFTFDAPVRLAAPSDRQPGNLRFPRPAGAGIVYRADGVQGVTELWYAPDPAVDAGVQLDGPGTARGAAVQGATPFELYFTIEPADLPGAAQIYHGAFDPAARLLGGEVLGAPFNTAPVEAGIAVAVGAERAFWMRGESTTALAPVTARLTDSVATPLALPLAGNCTRLETTDATLYASLDGGLLFYSAARRDAACAVVGDDDLWVAVASPTTGIPAPATRIDAASSEAGADLDPALSHDGCVLYFSSNRAAARFELYAARRR